MGEFNIAPNTQIGKIIIDEKVYNDENAYHIEEEKYSRGGEFIENLVTDSIIDFCHRWFHLANVEEAISDIDEYFEQYSIGKYSNLSSVFSPILPAVSKHQSAVYHTSSKSIQAVEFSTPRPKEYTYYNLIEEAKGR